MQRGDGELAGGLSRLGRRGKTKTAPTGTRRRGSCRHWLSGGVAVVGGLRRSRGTSLVHKSTTEPEFGHMHASGQRFSYDATWGVQMQVHLHRGQQICYWDPAQRRPGKRTGSSQRRRKDTGWVGVPPQKEMNGGSDAKRRAALAAESREMVEE